MVIKWDPLKGCQFRKRSVQIDEGPLSNPWVLKWDPCLGGMTFPATVIMAIFEGIPLKKSCIVWGPVSCNDPKCGRRVDDIDR